MLCALLAAIFQYLYYKVRRKEMLTLNLTRQATTSNLPDHELCKYLGANVANFLYFCCEKISSYFLITFINNQLCSEPHVLTVFLIYYSQSSSGNDKIFPPKLLLKNLLNYFIAGWVIVIRP